MIFLVVATYNAIGQETSSVTGTSTHFNNVQHGFDTHHEYASQTYTAVSTESPTYTQSMRWVTGVDDHHASANHTFDNTSTFAASDDQDTLTHTFTQFKADHYSVGASATQDSIDSRDYQSLWISHSETVLSDEQSTWATHSHINTASLSEFGAGADVTSTLNTSDSFTLQAHGSSYETSVEAWFHETANATDTNSETKTPIGGGATRTLDTSHHISFNAYDIFYVPNGGSPRYTHSTTFADHLVTLQNVGTLTESLVGHYTDALTFTSNKTVHLSSQISHTTGSLDENQEWQSAVSYDESNFDSDQTLSDNGVDPAWMAGIGAFAEALLDVILAGPSMIYMFIKHPCDPFTLLQRIGEGFIRSSIGLANSLVALATGKDPETGKTLSDKEYAEIVGGLLGTIAGLVIMQFAVKVVGGAVGNYLGKVASGQRCINPFNYCFRAETPIRLVTGSKPIEEIKDYKTHGDNCDWVWSRDEFDPDGPARARRVLEKFEGEASLVDLRVAGEVIGATPGHPLYVEGKGWTATEKIEPGQRIRLERDGWIPVEASANGGAAEKVYNLIVEDDHTYFVGSDEWGFAVWAHNGCKYYTKAQFDKQKGRVLWVNEKTTAGRGAIAYQAGAKGARAGKAPSLIYRHKDGTYRHVKFDGVDFQNKILIDRKFGSQPFHRPKLRDQAVRQSAALKQNGFKGVWEVQNKAMQRAARDMLQELNIKNITVRVVP